MKLLIHLNEYCENGDNYFPGGMPDLLLKVLDYINKNFVTIKSIGELEKIFGVSRSWLWRIFKKHLDMPPKSYIQYKRLTNARYLLCCGESVTNACMNSGFSDYSHFIALFRRTFGITPLKFRNYTNQAQGSDEDGYKL